MKPAESRHILFVLGMHRSGTSALCGALQACGASFGASLLAPMDGVNDEGFWEDSEVVQVNESLLELAGMQWYTVTPGQLPLDWQAQGCSQERSMVADIIGRGFGDGAVEVIKDPRLCITLPLWLSVCDQLGIKTSVCVIERAPLEVARSLQRRDGFPPGYGLRLLQTYRRGIARYAPADAVNVSYHHLLEDPAGVMRLLAELVPLQVDEAALAAAVRSDLRHQAATGHQGLLDSAEAGDVDLAALDRAIAESYPRERTLAEFAASLVDRGEQLTTIGSAHTTALATLDERDVDLDKLSREHNAALATISERDEQICSFDQRLAETGAHLAAALATLEERDRQLQERSTELQRIGDLHSHALEVIRGKDEHLERVLSTPGAGLLFRAMWKRESR